MVLQASGPISFSDIAVEKGISSASLSLATASIDNINTASTDRPDGVAPHLISEFYSYDHSATPGIVLTNLIFEIDTSDSTSYPGSGTEIYDTVGLITGSIVGSPVYSSSLASGSLVFDGINNYINFGSSAGTEIAAANEATLCFWVNLGDQNLDTELNNVSFLGAKWNSVTNQRGFRLEILPDSPVDADHDLRWFTSTNGSSNSYNARTNTQVGENQWLHIAVTHNSSNTSPNFATIYVNGSAQTVTNTGTDGSIFNSTFDYVVFAFNVAYNRRLRAAVAYHSMYDRELSSTEIQQNYNAQKSRFGL